MKLNIENGNYELHKSPGDGHCLIHSVLFGLKSAGVIIEKQNIISAVETETIAHCSKYMSFYVNPSIETLLCEMTDYLHHKHYDSSFGDIVPYILANALEINIVIMHDMSFIYDPYVVKCDNSCVDSNFITVCKRGMHYDAMTLKHESNVFLSEINENFTACDPQRQDLCVIDVSKYRSEAPVSKNTDNIDLDLSEMSNKKCPMKSKIQHSDPRHSSCINHQSVNILFWNIHGLSQDKLSDHILGSMLKQYDLILISETWASDQSDFILEGFEYHNYPRHYSHQNCKRNSGGLGVFVRQTIRGGIDMWCHTDDIIAWFIMRKSFFGLKHDVYIGNVYIVPENSTYLKHDAFDILYRYIEKIPDNAEVLLCGDFNARTGEVPDFVTHFGGSNGDLDNLLPPEENQTSSALDYLRDNGILNRTSMDRKSVNKHDTQLIEFCKTTGMLILNGRISHDRGIGCFTRDDTTGRSVVDYAIASPVILKSVSYFKVSCKFPESDHRPVSISLTCSHSSAHKTGQDFDNEWELCNKYFWSREVLNDLADVLADNESEKFLDSLLECINDICDMNTVAGKLDDYISQACQRVFQYGPHTRRVTKYVPPWFDNECRLKRSLAVRAGERISSLEDKDKQMTLCRAYRACKQRKHRKYNRKCIKDIENAYNTNRSNMWRVINDMSRNYSNVNEPSDSEFYDHFVDICLPQNAEYFDNDYENMATEFLKQYDNDNKFYTTNISTVEEILNDNFTVEEIEYAIDCLKTNKTPGLDSIPAEFIKACKHVLSPTVATVFNYIIEHRDFPETWSCGTRSAVFKSGKRNIVDNFRGITIPPIMEKIFEAAVYKRIVFVNEAFEFCDRYNNGYFAH